MPLPIKSFTRIANLPKCFTINHFRSRYFQPGLPICFPSGYFAKLPAADRWIQRDSPTTLRLNTSYLAPHEDAMVEMELTDHDEPDSFHRFTGSLGLFLKWQNDRLSSTTTTTTTTAQDPSLPSHIPPSSGQSLIQSQTLYISQTQLSALPPTLQADLPTPDLVQHAGRGDVYASSLWLGVPPTHTPLHRDPNPNLFVQLAGRKRVRLLPPAVGELVFETLRRTSMDSDGVNGGGQGSRMRGVEMMVGRESRSLEEWIWSQKDEARDVDPREVVQGFEAVLESGDGIFVPLGWWHAVRGEGEGINASVNWWFR